MGVVIMWALQAVVLGIAAAPVDDAWNMYYREGTPSAYNTTKSLLKRAESLAAPLRSVNLSVSGDVDMVISGGGNLDAYYMGIQTIFNRVPSLRMHRYAGASAGGMMPFEFALKGESLTVATHYAYAQLCTEYPDSFKNVATASYEQDHHWRLMAAWQTANYSSVLGERLDGKVTVALSCLDPLPKLVLVDHYTAVDDQATHAFMGTGTFFERYDGMPCTDGGGMSGPKMTPLFQDHARDQVIVDLMQTGQPKSMALAPVDLDKYDALARQGQDEAVAFLRTGRCRADAITLCPASADTSRKVCHMRSSAHQSSKSVWQ